MVGIQKKERKNDDIDTNWVGGKELRRIQRPTSKQFLCKRTY